MTKDIDICVYGATGFTGKRVALRLLRCHAQLSARLGRPCVWAISARDESRLADLLSLLLTTSRDDQDGDDQNNQNQNHTAIAAANSSLLPIVVPAALDHLDDLFARVGVVISCVGPFRFYGEPVVKACVDNNAHYVDITGEPEFVERIYATHNSAAIARNLAIVPTCGFDSVPADLGTLHTKRAFASRDWTCASIEMFVSIHSGPAGSRGNFTTLESAVHGLASANTLRDIRRLNARPDPKHIGPALGVRQGVWFSGVVQRWCVPFLGADASVVRMGQSCVERIRTSFVASSKTANRNNWMALQSVRFAAYFAVRDPVSLLGILIFGGAMSFLCRFKWGRSLLLKYPGLFSFGFFSRKGPNDAQLRESSFSCTFHGKGYRTLSTSTLTTERPDCEIITRVSGPEMGYVATPIAVIDCAMAILEDKVKGRNEVPAGVLTPASAFAGTDIIERLEEDGIKFSIVSVRENLK